MDQLIIYRAVGGDLPLLGFSPARGITKAEQSCQLLGEDVVNLTVESAGPLQFTVGNYFTLYGRRYTLNQMPTARKLSDNRFVYELTFEGPQYQLLRVLYFNTDVTGFNTSTEFSLTGDLKLMLDVLMNNVSRALTGWSLGTVVSTETKTLSFSNENGLAVLQRLCKEFGAEFAIIPANDGASNTITVGQVGQVLGYTFEYGRGKGLYELQRQTVSDKNFITRLYAYGGSKNLPSGYRNFSPRLQTGGTGSFIEKADAKQAFGLIEGTNVWEDIYPRRTGKISSVSTDGLTFGDSTMNFDLTEVAGAPVNGQPNYKYLLPGVKAKVHVNTGKLAGYEFEIAGYVHTVKQFTIIPFKDERGQNFPATGAFELSVGDEYVLLDVRMPDSYIQAAEAELLAAATTYLNQNAAPRVQYSLDVDELYLSGRVPTGSVTNIFSLGDTVTVIDTDLAINGGSRVMGFRRDLIRPYQYTLDISDHYDISLVERVLAEQTEIRQIVRVNDLRDARRAKAGYLLGQELLAQVFDPDGYLDADQRIKPLSIETAMLSVGSRSQQLALNCVLEPNYGGQANVVKVNAGTLTHYTISEMPKTWQLAEQTTTIFDTQARYIYARCHKTTAPADRLTDGSIVFSTQQLTPDQDANYYHFLIGVLHSVSADLGIRFISLTYGSTTINGRFIRTGRIQSADASTYFDLDTGEISGKISFTATNGTKRTVAEVDDLTGQKRRVFVATPVPPYEVGDLWTNGSDFFRCKTAKAKTAQFALADWELATVYDNTVTVIDGGIITSGRIQLAGSGGSVLAGITGEGVQDTSVRIWAGAAYANRNLAPFRVLQSGEVFARKRIEMMSSSNVGQAGICGANTSGDGNVRIWAGTDYANRNNAPFLVNADGSMVATLGRFGGWVISGDGIINEDGSAYIIARNKGGGVANRTEARIGANVFPATFNGKGAALFVAAETGVPGEVNYGAVFEAANSGENFAIYADRGTTYLGDALLNGRRYLGRNLADATLLVDPSMYDVIELYCTGNTSAGIKFVSSASSRTMRPGKEVTLILSNDSFNAFFIVDTLKGVPAYKVNGGSVMTLILGSFGRWYMKTGWDNNPGVWPSPFTNDPTSPGSGREPAPNTGTGNTTDGPWSSDGPAVPE